MICIICISNSVSYNLLRLLTSLYLAVCFMKLTVRGPFGRVGGRALALVEMGRGSALVHAPIRPLCMGDTIAMDITRNLCLVI